MKWFFGTRNVMEEVFKTNDALHVDLVHKELAQFKQAESELMSVDGKLAVGLGVDAALWMIGSLGAMMASVVLVALGYVALKKMDRPQLSVQFQEKLSSLMDVYHWMIKGNGINLTNADIFMDVMQAVAPYVETSELKPWDLRQSNPSVISNRHVQVLSLPPHRTELTMVRQPSFFGSFTQPAPSIEEGNPMLTTPAEGIANKAIHLYGTFKRSFEQTHAEAIRALYKYEPKALEPAPERAPRLTVVTR